MLRRLLDLLRRRRYLKESDRRIIESDIDTELDKKLASLVIKSKNTYNLERKKLIEIQVLRELLEENDNLYNESEINQLYYDIIREIEEIK